ncbi:MAG: tetratricopeptide repeat protein [Planctomycetes bacterium]|nr:tetratricopeptide repeat protein [Planctomycetota bacterium]
MNQSCIFALDRSAFAFSFLSLCVWASEPGRDVYDSASILFNAKEFELAIHEYQKVLDSKIAEDFKARAMLKIAECHFRMENYAKAGDFFRDYLKQFPSHDQRSLAQFRISECFYFNREYEKAARSYDRFIQENPGHEFESLALYAGANARWEQGDLEGAAKGYAELCAKFPQHKFTPKALFNMAWVEFQNKQFRDSAKDFMAYCNAYPETDLAVEARLRAADAYFRTDDFSESMKQYNLVLSRGEGAFYKEARRGIAWSYFKLAEYAKASKNFLDLARSSDALDAKVNAYYQAVQSFFTGEDYAEGLKAAEEMSTQADGHELEADSYYWQGIFLKKLNLLSKASQAFEKALSFDKSKVSRAEILLEQGKSLGSEKSYEKAIVVMDKAVSSVRPGERIFIQVQYDNARILHEAGKDAEALRALEKNRTFLANEKDSKLKPHWDFLMAECLLALKNHSRAAGLYGEILKENPSGEIAMDALYRQGWTLNLMEKFPESVAIFEDFAKKFPKSHYLPEVHYLTGRLYEKVGEDDKAASIYNDLILSKGSYANESYIKLAELLHWKKKDYGRVISLMQQFLTNYNGEELKEEAHLLLAESAYELKKMDVARNSYSAVANDKKSKLRDRALYGRAWIHYDAGRMSEAAADLENILSDPADGEFRSSATELLGKIYSQLNQTNKSRDLYVSRIAQAKGEEKAKLLLSLAGIEADLGNREEALKNYDRFLAEHPQSDRLGRALYEKGWLLMQMGKTEESRKSFTLYENKFPGGELTPDIEFALGEMAYEQEDYAASSAHYAACASHERYKDKALYKGAWCRLKMENYSEAAELFARLVKECETSPLGKEAAYRLAMARMKEGDADAAAKLLENFLRNAQGDPFYSEALFNYAKICEKQGRLDDARLKYEDYLRLFPKEASCINAHYSLGKIHLEQGLYAKAKDHFSQVIKADKTHFLALDAQFSIGECLFFMSEYSEAIKAFYRCFLYKDGRDLQAEALFRIHQCNTHLGQAEKAAECIDRLLKEYPGTEAAKRALELKRIK